MGAAAGLAAGSSLWRPRRARAGLHGPWGSYPADLASSAQSTPFTIFNIVDSVEVSWALSDPSRSAVKSASGTEPIDSVHAMRSPSGDQR